MLREFCFGTPALRSQNDAESSSLLTTGAEEKVFVECVYVGGCDGCGYVCACACVLFVRSFVLEMSF